MGVNQVYYYYDEIPSNSIQSIRARRCIVVRPDRFSLRIGSPFIIATLVRPRANYYVGLNLNDLY